MKFISLINLLLLAFLSSCSLNEKTNIKEIASPAGENSMYPRLFTDNTGTVFMSWLEQNDKLSSLKYASFKNGNWSEPQVIAADSGWFINWADFPSIIAQDGNPMAAHWLNKLAGDTYAYEINMSVFDGSWGEPFTPHKDGTPTEHGFLSMIPTSDSAYFATWLDGRNTENRSDDEYGDLQKAMTLRGALISKSGQVLEKYLLDDSVCDCCNTTVAKTEKGIIVAYRNRTENEIRDIYTVTVKNGIVSEPQKVHSDKWEIAACPVNGPAIATDGNKIALAWFTGADGEPKVKMALSDNAGKDFDSPIILDEHSTLGRLDIEMVDGKIWISRITKHQEENALKISMYDYTGNKLSDHIIEEISGNRNAGFPQITKAGDGILIANTNEEKGKTKVKVRYLN
ncbi:hypothetical protein [Gracilimonas tropica]|uniref:hypothetical protein n=1 Tax=Gracilimonas tropica TaxID=454600 RepID=UPI000377363E|nr:hypothetical protein [Gracilimonas tropica]